MNVCGPVLPGLVRGSTCQAGPARCLLLLNQPGNKTAQKQIEKCHVGVQGKLLKEDGAI